LCKYGLFYIIALILKEAKMLRQLRKKKIAKRILWVLAALIVPAFVLWGAGSSTREKGRGLSYVGKIYGKKITFEKFGKSYQNCYHQLLLSSGGDLNLLKEMIASMNINQIAWDRLIMLEEARRERIKVGDQEVIAAISSNPLFKRSGGFDKKIYDYILRNHLKTTPREFEEEVRENITLEKLKYKLVEDISISDDEVLQGYKKENDKTSISFILINPEDSYEKIEITDEELKSFYEARKQGLQKGNEVNIEYFQIETEDTQLLSKITEEINNDGGFKQIVEENALESKETGFFGVNDEIPGIGPLYELTNVAFQMEKDATSLPVYTQKGYYVINIKDTRTGYIPSFEQIKTSLQKELTKTMASASAREDATDTHQQILKLIEEGSSFKQAVKKLNLSLKESQPFSTQEYIEGLGQAELVKRVAFSLPEEEISSPTPCEKGFAIFKRGEIIPAEMEKFEEEKEKLRQTLLNQKRSVVLNSWFMNVSKNATLEADLNLLLR